MWQEYLDEYAKLRPECLLEWKSSPLADDHDFSQRMMNLTYEETAHQSQVIDLKTHTWGDIRKSYHSLIHRAKELYTIEPCCFTTYRDMHRAAFGNIRPLKTFDIQHEWFLSGYAISICAKRKNRLGIVAVAMWIVYEGSAYYASGPSTERDVQHAVIARSLEVLQQMEVLQVDLGQIDGETEKEKGIAMFKRGFGGESQPFKVIRVRP